MDPHSEVEIKYNATDLTTQEFMAGMCRGQSACLFDVLSFKTVSGNDTYYSLGGRQIRYRLQASDGFHELTYKARKSQASIVDRVELNVRLDEKASPATVVAMIEALGGKLDFKAEKTSYIYHVAGRLGGSVYLATVALYDVTVDERQDRYLEVEIESTSTCTPAVALEVLDVWQKFLRKEFNLEVPLNASLAEIYTPKKGTNQ